MSILSQKEEGGKERFSEDSKNSTHFQGYSTHFQDVFRHGVSRGDEKGRKPAGGKKENK